MPRKFLGPKGFILIAGLLLASHCTTIQENFRGIERKFGKQDDVSAQFLAKDIHTGKRSEIIQLRSIEAFKELAKSPNTKIIITDGKTPMMISNTRGK